MGYSLDSFLSWANRHPLDQFLHDPHATDVGEVVWGNGPSLGLVELGRGAAAPWVTPNRPIFGEWSPLILLNEPMWWFHGDEVIWFGFVLVLLSVGPCFAWLWAFSPLGSCRVYILLSFFYTLGSFYVQSRHVLLQTNNYQNSWNWLVISHNSKFGVYFSSFYINVEG